MLFLLQLIKDGKIQALLKNGLRFIKQYGILQEGRHRMTVTLTITGEDGRQAKADLHVDYDQGRAAKFPSILSLDADDWTIIE